MHGLSCLDLTLPTPAESLACDEALLDLYDADATPGILRFWEPRSHFVVLGYANRAEREADLHACRQLQVPVLRRCSGGGAVLQGPGCLNFSLVLPIAAAPDLETITQANRFIMERHRLALSCLLHRAVSIQGDTDLALDNLKFSGNAQRRGRLALLFHGTFLLDFDPALMGRLLRPPSRQPSYRQQRSHSAFLTRLNLPPETIKLALRQTWNATQNLEHLPNADIQRLVQQKYFTDAWNFRW